MPAADGWARRSKVSRAVTVISRSQQHQSRYENSQCMHKQGGHAVNSDSIWIAHI